MNYISIVLFFLVFALPKADELQEFKIKGYAQGTSYSITYYAKEEWVKKDDVDSILAVIDQSMSLYKPNSLINKFNESTGGMPVDFHFMEVYKRANSIFKDTQGKFDVTVAPLVQAWGFGPKKVEKFPDDATIKNLLNGVGMDKLSRHHLTVSKKNPNVQIDFNGIAQGYTVDVLAKFLQLRKINRFMVEVGGELCINGTKPDGQLFKIGIEGPTNTTLSNQTIKHIIQFKNGAITTSGNYQKYVMNGNQRISHLIDPKTGYPLKNEMISVTVFAKDAITADGYDNALMAMNVKEALAFAGKRKNMEVYIIYTRPNGELADTMSVGFDKLIVKPVDWQAETKDKPLKIVLISDLNGSYGSLIYSKDVPSVLNEIGQIKPDLILCGGDMVAGQKTSLTEQNIKEMWQSFKNVVLDPIKKANVPFGFTLGNHDASPGFLKDRALASQFWKDEQAATRLTFVDSEHYPFYFSYIKNNVFFISWDASGAAITPELYNWLKTQTSLPIAKNARMRILLGHLPLYAIVAAKNKPGEVISNPDSALAFFKTHGIDMYISGHQHAYYPAIKNGVHLLNSGCIGDGPRPILGHSDLAKKAYTVIEIPVKKPLKFTQRAFMPANHEEISIKSLPDSVIGFNGIIHRID